MDAGQRAAERGAVATGTVGTARQAIGDVSARARSTVDQVADAAADVADRVGAQANDALAQALRYTSAHPLQALAVVLAAGFLAGRLSRRD
jgi:ElaB/YqjD/DUF883 family membrane-anchored ribosome-binding protein